MKPWYEKAEYKKSKPKTPYDHWHRVWDKFQETIAIKGYDNSTGSFNYLIGKYIFESSGCFNEKEFINTINNYLKEE